MHPQSATEQYFKELANIPLLQKKSFEKLWKLSKKGDKKAKLNLIESNLRLVLPIARKYHKPGIELLDLIEEGNLGLIHALEKYNPKKKVQFSTYANYWIEQYVRRAVEEHSKTIRIPTHIWEDLRKWLKNWEMFHAQLGRYPTITEMAQKLNLSVRQIKNIIDTIELVQGVGSLDTPIDKDGELFMKDIITDKDSKTPEMLIATLRLHDELDQALSKLNDRERKIIQLRYGLINKEITKILKVAKPQLTKILIKLEKEMHIRRRKKIANKIILIEKMLKKIKKLDKGFTLEEIALIFKIWNNQKLSRERVRQLEKRGLYQLRWIAYKMKVI
ncbi:MAG: sigma-70 family RNA polymerase sigma factor [Elusimicrobiota bacterium]|nr:sigma-70 family RNA polymerase sigma factor [Elusimicrobiota bacterium]